MNTVFVVDENQTYLVAADSALQQKYNVVTMDRAANIFKAALQDSPDLILLDMEMSDISSLAVLKRLKEDELLRDVPIIILSVDTVNEKIIAAMQRGAVDFVRKPFSHSIINKRVAAALSKQKPKREYELLLY